MSTDPQNTKVQLHAAEQWFPKDIPPTKRGRYLVWIEDRADIGGYVDHAEVAYFDPERLESWFHDRGSAVLDGCYMTMWAKINPPDNIPTEKKGGAA